MNSSRTGKLLLKFDLVSAYAQASELRGGLVLEELHGWRLFSLQGALRQ